MNLICPDQLRRIESHLDASLRRIFADNTLTGFNDAVRQAVLSGGKRLRPQLCVWTYTGLTETGDKTLPTPLLDLASGWEMFHAFLLAHDDIIDAADTRRDRPTLHQQLAQLDGGAEIFGKNLGIVAGDLLFSAAMHIWHELDLPADIYREELKLFSRVACTTGFGQAIDVCQSHAGPGKTDEATVLHGYLLKTAAYTFEGPMLSAALLTRETAEARNAISRFALALGQAYQLQNDLNDLAHPPRLGGDLVQGKRTITLLRGRSAMNRVSQIELDEKLHVIEQSDGDLIELAESIRQDLFASGAVRQTQDLVSELISQARDAASDKVLKACFSQRLIALLDSLSSRYFVTV